MGQDEADFPYPLTAHAHVSLRKRPMPLEWVKRTIERPDHTEPDAQDPALRHALRTIPENERRVLRVIYNHTTHPFRVVTFYFDRRMSIAA
ncbi:MAG: DUF4258 domain-containing protein [Phycisphaeraceae bacterium]